jgi:hypothetical protein
MELHRSRKLLLAGVFFLLAGLGIVLCAGTGSQRSVIRLCISGAAILVGVAFVVRELRPFAFRIGADGLTLRTAEISRAIPWAEVDAIIMGQPARPPEFDTERAPALLLVPAAGSPLADRLDQRSPIDRRPCRSLLDTGDVQESADEIAAALSRFAGGRFVDARQQGVARRTGPDFTMVLRGYEPVTVDSLIRQAENALATDSASARWAVKALIGSTPLTVVLRGYDRGQVDTHLTRLATLLTTPPTP